MHFNSYTYSLGPFARGGRGTPPSLNIDWDLPDFIGLKGRTILAAPRSTIRFCKYCKWNMTGGCSWVWTFNYFLKEISPSLVKFAMVHSITEQLSSVESNHSLSIRISADSEKKKININSNHDHSCFSALKKKIIFFSR